MKVVCIEVLESTPHFSKWLDILGNFTLGKIYEAKDTGGHYQITDDIGIQGIYTKSLFKLIDEVREEKLNNLGI